MNFHCDDITMVFRALFTLSGCYVCVSVIAIPTKRCAQGIHNPRGQLPMGLVAWVPKCKTWFCISLSLHFMQLHFSRWHHHHQNTGLVLTALKLQRGFTKLPLKSDSKDGKCHLMKKFIHRSFSSLSRR